MRFAKTALLGALSGTALSAVLLTACVFVHAEDTSKHKNASSSKSMPTARATIESKSGSSLTGTATFTEVSGGVTVEIRISNAPPGWHAAHLHEVGDCSADDGTSAGGHFNPGGTQHGSPHAPEHHAGDLGNLYVYPDGTGLQVIHMPGLSVTAGPMSVRDRAIIIHAGADDLVSQPTGAAGGRIGCGVIR
jgi:Cu-Zn family superoxide dismutase